MEQFRDNQRYSLEEAQEEARVLKLMLELGEYGCQTYDEAEFYLPDFHLEQATMLGQAARRAAEFDDIPFDDPQNPIIDSEWGRWGEIDMLPESALGEPYGQDEEDRDLYAYH